MVAYYGGPVLANVRVISVMWGPDVYPDVATQMGRLYASIVNSTFVDSLSQYRTPTQTIGRGTFVGTFTLYPNNTSDALDDSNIGPELAAQINAGQLPSPDANTLYVIHLPPGKTITMSGKLGCLDFCAYHYFSNQRLGSTPTNIVYAVLPDYSPASSCSPGPLGSTTGCGDLTPLFGEMEAASHEIAEAITDPLFCPHELQGCTTAAWQPEIGDPCEYFAALPDGTLLKDQAHAQMTRGGAAFAVQKIWSATTSACHGDDGFAATQPLAAGLHTCVREPGGTLYCWGDNSLGQLGIGTLVDQLSPVRVPGLDGVLSVTASRAGSCALLSDDSVRCWGFGDSVGNGTTTGTTSPTRALVDEALGLSSSWGAHCALSSGGLVQCWGSNRYGTLGDGDQLDSPLPVSAMVSGTPMAIAGGGNHSCALLTDGQVQCWGENEFGQLGDGTNTLSPVPIAVGSLPTAVEISAGGYHTCALSSDGSVWCWGYNADGELGNGANSQFSLTPTLVQGMPPATEVVAGSNHTCSLGVDRKVRCWGLGTSGQLGNGAAVSSTSPVVVNNVENVVALAAGDAHTCALNATGSVQCWGLGQDGELGNGGNGNSTVPVWSALGVAVPLGGTTALALMFVLAVSGVVSIRADRRR
jgi:alpha-tubulin suppressor-like RCC1 family protein